MEGCYIVCVLLLLSLATAQESSSSFAKVKEIVVPGQESMYEVDFLGEDEPEDGGRSLGNEQSFDTSLAVSVPLFSYSMPGYRENPSHSDLLAQAGLALGGLGLLATVATIPLYLGLDGSTMIGRSNGPLETMAGLADSWARAIGMDQCGQMAICDAHARYSDYGVLALPLVLLFPGSINRQGEPASIWQEAAMRGKAREACYSRYNCLINPLSIVKFIITALS